MNDDTQTANSPDEAQDITILAPVPVITEENGEHVLRYTVGERTYIVTPDSESSENGGESLPTEFTVNWTGLIKDLRNGDETGVLDAYEAQWPAIDYDSSRANGRYEWPSHTANNIEPTDPAYNAGDYLATRWMLDAVSLLSFHYMDPLAKDHWIERALQMVEAAFDARDVVRFGSNGMLAPAHAAYTKGPKHLLYDENNARRTRADGTLVPHIGWGVTNGDSPNEPAREAMVLTDGRTLAWITDVLLYVLALDDKKGWHKRAHNLFALVPDIIDAHEEFWVPRTVNGINNHVLSYGYRIPKEAPEEYAGTAHGDGEDQYHSTVLPTNHSTALLHAAAAWDHYAGTTKYEDKIEKLGAFYNAALNQDARTSFGSRYFDERPTLWYQLNPRDTSDPNVVGGPCIPQDSNHLGAYEIQDYSFFSDLGYSEWPRATIKTMLDAGVGYYSVPGPFRFGRPSVYYYAHARYHQFKAKIDKPNLSELAQDHLFLIMEGAANDGGRGSPTFAQMIHDAYHELREYGGVSVRSMASRYNVVLHAALHMHKFGKVWTDAGGNRGTLSTAGVKPGAPNSGPSAAQRAASFALAVRSNGGSLNASQESALEGFYASGIANGWLDALHTLFVASAPNETVAKLDLVAPVKDGSPNVLTPRNGQSAIPWVAGQGFKLDDTLDPKPGYKLPFNPKAEAVQDDFGLILGLSSINGNGNPDIRDSSSKNLLTVADSMIRSRLQSDTIVSWTVGDGLPDANNPGIYIVQRAVGDQNVEAYRFGTQLDSKTVASIEPNQYGDEIVLGAARSQDQVSGRTVTVVGTTRRLTAQQVSQLTAALNALMNSWSL